MKNAKTTTKSKQELNPMELLLKQTNLSSVKKGQKVDAKIISLSKKEAKFDIGAKTYAILGSKELKDLALFYPFLKKGMTVPAVVISEESREGFPVISLKDFFNEGRWQILEEKKNSEEEIEVIAGEYGKGGVFVNFMGIRGVIPKIQLTPEYIKKPEKLENKRIKVKVLEVDKEKNRLVVSQKAAVLNLTRKQLEERFKKIKVGEKYKAKVINVSEFGIFCEIDKIEGLVHISEISWEKVDNPTKYAQVGDEIDVIVTEKNEKDMKLNLSIKRLTDDPWKDIEKRFPKDKEVEGIVVRKENYGYFVKIDKGIEGLIHISKLPKDRDLQIGQKVKVYIEKLDLKRRKISLLLEQTTKPLMYR
ncbi:MAG: 30S ribosomal protein S1 [Patescibacteria group bacterium]|nr:MAG: 30S ribosomal protein S1 [Patescibacteria group bacterium]